MKTLVAIGAQPVPTAKPFRPGEEQLRYFRECWSDTCRTVPNVPVEVQNNNVPTPPAAQRQLVVASTTAVDFVLRGSP